MGIVVKIVSIVPIMNNLVFYDSISKMRYIPSPKNEKRERFDAARCP